MKLIVSAILSLALMAPIAALADAFSPAGAPASHNWSGVYVGANGGYGKGRFEDELSNGSFTFLNFAGGFAGAQVGFNVQNGPFVWGVEVDHQKSWQKGSRTFSAPGATQINAIEVPWFTTARLRGGIAIGPSLVYATGGRLFAESRNTTTLNGLRTSDVTDRRDGWAVGGGFEAIVSPQWSWKIEYLYLKPEEESTRILGVTRVERVHDQIVRFGINYRFGG